jgi:type IV pilus assembly protein PilB
VVLRGAALQTFLDAITATNGIILITGPTGSGKTRTLEVYLSRLNDPS